jgi:hypothetical protein
MLTLPEILEKMKDIDEITLLEVLEISSEEIVDRFSDRIEEQYEKFNGEFDEG